MFAHFSLPNIGEVVKRTTWGALVFGVVALIVAVVLGYYLVGIGACIGLALGTFNFRMMDGSVARVSELADDNKKKPLALNTLGRMGIITVVTLGLVFAVPAMGFGVLGGLAAFQILLVANAARSMASAGPMTSVDDVITANVVEDRPSSPAVSTHAVIDARDDSGKGA